MNSYKYEITKEYKKLNPIFQPPKKGTLQIQILNLNLSVHNIFIYLVASQLIAVSGSRESLVVPFGSFKEEEDFESQKYFNSSSNDGVFNSSIDVILGRLNGLFFGVEHVGSSTFLINNNKNINNFSFLKKKKKSTLLFRRLTV